ncbi:hypothetical protein Gotur_008810 [Gossypium turneri]
MVSGSEMANVEGDFQVLSVEDAEEKKAVRLEEHRDRDFWLSNGRFLYKLFHKVDVDRIEARGPWNFNSHLLILRRLHDGDDPKTIPLNTIDFWVLVQELPH